MRSYVSHYDGFREEFLYPTQINFGGSYVYHVDYFWEKLRIPHKLFLAEVMYPMLIIFGRSYVLHID